MSIDETGLRRMLAAATQGEWWPGVPDDDHTQTRAEWVCECLIGPDEPAAGALWVAWVPDDTEVAGSRVTAVTGDGAHGKADAELICAAINALPGLLDELAERQRTINYFAEGRDHARAERDALAANLDTVRELAEHYAGLTNVDAGSAILRTLDATPETGGES